MHLPWREWRLPMHFWACATPWRTSWRIPPPASRRGKCILITQIMRYNASEAPQKMGTFSQYPYPHALERYCECARFVGVTGANDEEVFENFITKIEALKERVGIRKTIRDYGVEESVFLETLDDMCEQAFDDQCTGANPRYPLISEIREMYLTAYYGA